MSHIDHNGEYSVCRHRTLKAVKSVCEKCPHYTTESWIVGQDGWCCTLESPENQGLDVCCNPFVALPIDCPYIAEHAVVQPPPFVAPKWLETRDKTKSKIAHLVYDEAEGREVAIYDE